MLGVVGVWAGGALLAGCASGSVSVGAATSSPSPSVSGASVSAPSVSGTSPSTSSPPSAGQCFGFAVSRAVGTTGGAKTPLAAAVAYLGHPDVPGLPSSGWRVAETDVTGVMVRSGTSRLHAGQDPDNGGWWIDAGEACGRTRG